MFFKRRSFRSPSWWEGVKRKQNEWAHKAADYLDTKAAKVSVRRLRVYMLLLIAVWTATDMTIAWKKMREPSSGQLPDLHHWPERMIVPMPDGAMNRDGFETFLEKLRHDTVKGKVVDSFLLTRPGLVDTIRTLESMSR
jgi:hypothetical protein